MGRVDEREVNDPEAYLVRVVTRLALDVLRSSRERRETQLGEWLPEPILTGPEAEDAAERAEDVSAALLLVLETLSPRERAVYVLREAFGYSHAEVAVVIDRSETAVRQIARRARLAVDARHRRFDVDPATRRRVVEGFREACERGNIDALMTVLAPDVTMISDGGGRTFAPRRPIQGNARVAHSIQVLSRQRPAGTRSQVVELNGAPGLLLSAGGVVFLAVTLELGDRGIAQLQVVSDPAKITLTSPQNRVCHVAALHLVRETTRPRKRGDAHMTVAYLTITILAALSSGAGAVANLTAHPFPKKEADRLGIAYRWMPLLGTLLGAGAAGLLIGIAVPVIGVLASGGLVIYFIGALVAHLRVRDRQLWGWAGFFVLSTAAFAVNTLHL